MRRLAGKLLCVVLTLLWSLPSLAPLVALASQEAGTHRVFASLGHGHVDLVFTHCDPAPPTAPHDHPHPTGDGHDEDHVVHFPHPDEQRLNRDTDLVKPSIALAEALFFLNGLLLPPALTSVVAVPPPPDFTLFWLAYLHAAVPPRAPSFVA
jgi:hypothetical protein